MIEELHIRALGVIEDTTLSLGPGLTVVTGETGAGKTMIVTALELLLGGRSSSDLVRKGSETAIIEAVLRAPASSSGGATDLEDEDLWSLAEDGVLIVSREIPASGRSRARVGGRLVPVSALATLLRPHVEVHGQHEHIRLEQPAVQRQLLDAFAGPDHAAVLDAYGQAYTEWSGLRSRRQLLDEDATARARRLDQLGAERDEIDRANLDPDRDSSIDQDIDRLANADALRDAVEQAKQSAGPSGALDAVGRAVAALRRAPVADASLAAMADRLAAISRDLSEVVADLAAFASDVEADDHRLDLLQMRKRELTTLMRRFGASVEAVLAHRSAVQVELSELAALEQDADSIDADLERTVRALAEAGEQLSASRRAAGERLGGLVDSHLAELGLVHAQLHVDVTEGLAPTPSGSDRVELLLAANPGEPPARLADGASGGERSRVALALEVVLATGDDREVLVFDEIDAGVGGSTALAVGAKLARLARGARAGRQILCVTHLAQVAAFADHHHVVEKGIEGGRTVTTVRRVADDARVEELSRMLGGEATADAGLAHARGLLRSAREHSEA